MTTTANEPEVQAYDPLDVLLAWAHSASGQAPTTLLAQLGILGQELDDYLERLEPLITRMDLLCGAAELICRSRLAALIRARLAQLFLTVEKPSDMAHLARALDKLPDWVLELPTDYQQDLPLVPSGVDIPPPDPIVPDPDDDPYADLNLDQVLGEIAKTVDELTAEVDPGRKPATKPAGAAELAALTKNLKAIHGMADAAAPAPSANGSGSGATHDGGNGAEVAASAGGIGSGTGSATGNGAASGNGAVPTAVNTEPKKPNRRKR
ncbi:hypothetical protein JW859_00195 [bacterium]|nr:hypothetical protein [bacterium]